MHEFLSAVGLKSLHTKAQLKELTDWVIEDPIRLSIVGNGEDGNLAMAEREVAPNAGVAVVGEIDEAGDLIPEYYFPYLNSTAVSSEARLTYEKLSTREGFIGMCEDFRLGMALIFSVKNITDVMKNEQVNPLGTGYRKVLLSALASEGTVILPLYQNEKVLKQAKDQEERRRQIMESLPLHDDPNPHLEEVAQQDMRRYDQLMRRLESTDVFTVVDTFFMPYGMESDRYYLLGKILSCQLLTNEYSGEKFYRMLIEANDMTLALSINAADLLGVPEVGCRIKCRAWLTGEMK